MSVRFSTRGEWFVTEADSVLDILDLPKPGFTRHHTIERIWTHGGAPGKGFKKEWAGSASTVAGFRDHVLRGNPAAAERIRVLRDRLIANVPPPVEIRRRSRWRDDGDEIDRDRMMSGDLDRAWWGTERRARTGNPVLRVFVNVSFNCEVKPEVLFWNGAVAAAVADIAERAGWRVEIIGTAAAHNTEFCGKGNSRTSWVVKNAGDPMDLDAIGASLADAAAFRIVGFAGWLAAAAKFGKVLNGHLGFADMTPPEECTAEDVYIYGVTYEQAAIRALEAAIATLTARMGQNQE